MSPNKHSQVSPSLTLFSLNTIVYQGWKVNDTCVNISYLVIQQKLQLLKGGFVRQEFFEWEVYQGNLLAFKRECRLTMVSTPWLTWIDLQCHNPQSFTAIWWVPELDLQQKAMRLQLIFFLKKEHTWDFQIWRKARFPSNFSNQQWRCKNNC